MEKEVVITQEEKDKYNELYYDFIEEFMVYQPKGSKPTTNQIRSYLTKENLKEKEINKFIKYLNDEEVFLASSKTSSNSNGIFTSKSSSKTSNKSNSIFSSKSSIKSSSSPFSNTSHTLLFNCCHGVLPTSSTNKYNKYLISFKNPIQKLNRLIEGAQMCITSHYVNDKLEIIKELQKKNWNTLNKSNIEQAKEIIENLKGYKSSKLKPKEDTFYYSYIARNNQLHNRLQFITNTVKEEILNKFWNVDSRIDLKSPSGIYFVNKTTFIVPGINYSYMKETKHCEHFDFETNQITYSKFYNILTCPIYKQYNNYYLQNFFKIKLHNAPSWSYNNYTDSIEYIDMLYETNAYILYHYLINIPNISMIDNSCEVNEHYQEIHKLKKLRDSYRKLGPKIGKKLVEKMTKKIYRLENKLKTKARGKTKKNI